MQKMEAGGGRTERRQRAAAEIRNQLAGLYRGFVAWASLYGDADSREEQDRRRDRVAGLLNEFSNGYLARSMWLEAGTRKKIEAYIEKSEDLYSEFCANIVEQGYTRTRSSMAQRISRKLGPLRKEAEADLKEEPDDPRPPRWRRRP